MFGYDDRSVFVWVARRGPTKVYERIMQGRKGAAGSKVRQSKVIGK